MRTAKAQEGGHPPLVSYSTQPLPRVNTMGGRLYVLTTYLASFACEKRGASSGLADRSTCDAATHHHLRGKLFACTAAAHATVRCVATRGRERRCALLVAANTVLRAAALRVVLRGDAMRPNAQRRGNAQRTCEPRCALPSAQACSATQGGWAAAQPTGTSFAPQAAAGAAGGRRELRAADERRAAGTANRAGERPRCRSRRRAPPGVAACASAKACPPSAFSGLCRREQAAVVPGGARASSCCAPLARSCA